MTEEKIKKKKKRSYDQARGKSCINISEAFQQRRDLRELKGMKMDAEVALFLLDRWVLLCFTEPIGQL